MAEPSNKRPPPEAIHKLPFVGQEPEGGTPPETPWQIIQSMRAAQACGKLALALTARDSLIDSPSVGRAYGDTPDRPDPRAYGPTAEPRAGEGIMPNLVVLSELDSCDTPVVLIGGTRYVRAGPTGRIATNTSGDITQRLADCDACGTFSSSSCVSSSSSSSLSSSSSSSLSSNSNSSGSCPYSTATATFSGVDGAMCTECYVIVPSPDPEFPSIYGRMLSLAVNGSYSCSLAVGPGCEFAGSTTPSGCTWNCGVNSDCDGVTGTATSFNIGISYDAATNRITRVTASLNAMFPPVSGLCQNRSVFDSGVVSVAPGTAISNTLACGPFVASSGGTVTVSF